MELLRIENLHKSFGEGPKRVEVLKGIDLTVAPGESIAIWGASGVGKSTFLHIIGGLDRPTQGRVFYQEEDLFALDEEERARFRNRKMGFVFQFHHLLPEFTALENTMMPALIHGLPPLKAQRRAQDVLTRVGLIDRIAHKPGMLSGGEQQRVAVARAIVMEPEIVLADEPTGNLDSTTGEVICQLLLALNRSLGITLVLVTHNEKVAASMSKKLLMRDGQILPTP